MIVKNLSLNIGELNNWCFPLGREATQMLSRRCNKNDLGIEVPDSQEYKAGKIKKPSELKERFQEVIEYKQWFTKICITDDY